MLVDTVVSRGEFLTSYTPYQAEISQGTLTTIFEFQTMICQLTGMEVANASMYDGSTAVPEAAMMAMRVTGRDRVLVARTVHPEYREVLLTYAQHQGMPVAEFGYETDSGTLDTRRSRKQNRQRNRGRDHSVAELLRHRRRRQAGGRNRARAWRAADLRVRRSRLARACWSRRAMPTSSPANCNPSPYRPVYGGPFAGIIATKEKFMRQIPGRLVGETKDTRGNRAFCLTLATREQHIRREKATSNICTNQALIALMATVFMTVYGKEGLRELAEQNLAKAHYLAGKLPLRFSGPFFNEFVASTNGRSPDQINERCSARKSSAACRSKRYYPELENTMLLCATEMTRREQHGCGSGGVRAMIKKVRQHINQNEPLLFERSSPGKSGYQLPPLDVPAVDRGRGARRSQHARRKSKTFPKSAKWKPSATSRASPRRTTPSISASIRSAPAP